MILIIPDVHGRRFWKESVNEYKDKVEKIVFLGDYLDPYPIEGITRKQAIDNFSEILSFKETNADKTVLLVGNHDEQYIDRTFDTRSRYDASHAQNIAQMFNSHMSWFKLAYEHEVGGKKYLFTHAGLMMSWYTRNQRVIGDLTVDNLNRLATFHNGIKTLTDISRYRTWLGDPSGSILWSDLFEKIDDPSDAVVDGFDYQIFGHTQQEKEKGIIGKQWACLDCRRAFLLNDDGELIMLDKREESHEEVEADEEQ